MENTGYLVRVNYRLSVEEALKRANIDSNPCINSENFPTKRKGKSEITIELVHFGCMILTDNALKELGQKGYRPAELHELLALLEEHPDLLKKNVPIVALGSIYKDPYGDYTVPCFLDMGRRLDLNDLKGDWHTLWRFAAVRK